MQPIMQACCVLLPAVRSARGAARKATCLNNMRQVELGLTNGRGYFPNSAVIQENLQVDVASPRKTIDTKKSSLWRWIDEGKSPGAPLGGDEVGR